MAVVLLVADRVAHVVEQPGHLEQRARRRRQVVERREVVEELEAEPGHLDRVRLVEVEAAPHHQRGLVQAVVLAGFLAADEVHQDALAQPPLDGGHRFEPQVLDQLLEDDRPGADDLRPASVEPLSPLGR